MKITIEIPTAGESHIVVPADSSPQHQDALDRINAELQARMEAHRIAITPNSTWESVAHINQAEIDRLNAEIQDVHKMLTKRFGASIEDESHDLSVRIDAALDKTEAAQRELHDVHELLDKRQLAVFLPGLSLRDRVDRAIELAKVIGAHGKGFRVPAKGDKLRCIKCTPQMSGNVQVGEVIEFTGDDLFFGTNSYAMPLSCFEPV